MNMTVKDYLKFAAAIKDVPPHQVNRQLDKVLEECQLVQVKNKTIGNLSKGYKQRVGIAQAIIHEPKILILDEPTSGLDPIQNLQVRKLIQSLNNERTVILSTHILSEIEQIAKRVLMIKSGQIIVDDTLDHILRKNQADPSKRLTLEEFFVQCHQGDKELA
jgi:ABC-2 type transport system ATP-binding protein